MRILAAAASASASGEAAQAGKAMSVALAPGRSKKQRVAANGAPPCPGRSGAACQAHHVHTPKLSQLKNDAGKQEAVQYCAQRRMQIFCLRLRGSKNLKEALMKKQHLKHQLI
mgnify:CR=1 FL=1